MATFEHTVSTSTVYRWSIPAAEPWGAAAEEIAKAWGAAETTYRQVKGLSKDVALSGNALSFHADDDSIVIAFTHEQPKDAA